MKLTYFASASINHISAGDCGAFLMLESRALVLKWPEGMILLTYEIESATFSVVAADGGEGDGPPPFSAKMRRFFAIVSPWIAAQLAILESALQKSHRAVGVIQSLPHAERKWLDSITAQVFERLIFSDVEER